MKILDPQTVEQATIRSLRLGPDFGSISAPQVLSALLRRCGAFTCPCSPTTLINAAMSLLNGVGDEQSVRDLLPDILDQSLAYGDFIETREITGGSNARLLYVAPPAFVEMSPERFVIIGIAPDDIQVISGELITKLRFVGHARMLEVEDRIGVRSQLIAAGLIEVSSKDWLKTPESRTAMEHQRSYSSALMNCQRPGVVAEMLILDPSKPVNYYNGRWQKVKRQSGAFIARRPQTYGAQLWACVELNDGNLERLLDLPHFETHWRACDEAWHLQQAVDANLGHPQVFRVKPDTADSCILELFSPVPAWAQRRWDVVGERLKRAGSLISYRFDNSAIGSEVQWARETMWLTEASRTG